MICRKKSQKIIIETNASDYGLGAVLLQGGRPVAFASHTMTETERRYSQIEKECLDHYLHGCDMVTAVTDHKPLETILVKSIKSAPKRIQYMILCLQKYQLNVVYKKGTLMYISGLATQPNGREGEK